MTDPNFDELQRVIIEGDREGAKELADKAVASGADLVAVVERGLAVGIRRVGELWEEGEYFLPELVQGAEAMKAAMAVLQPALATRKTAEPKGTVVIGTVGGDMHDIGKTLVATLLEANGFKVHDLGHDVPSFRFVDKAKELGADIVAASALLTTTMTQQREIVAGLREAGLGDTHVLVGGAPTTPAWAKSIGATHAENAQRAVAVAESLLA